MKWNAVLNGFAAAAYIGIVDIFFQVIMAFKHNSPDTPFDPLIILSVFVFSAAVMSFLFFYQPVMLLIDNKKKEALSYFSKTLGTFGAITLVLLVIFLAFA